MARKKKAEAVQSVPDNLNLVFLQRRYVQLMNELQSVKPEKAVEIPMVTDSDVLEGLYKEIEEKDARIEDLEVEVQQMKLEKEQLEAREDELEKQLSESEKQLETLKETVELAIQKFRKILGYESLEETCEMYNARRALEDLADSLR